MQVDTVQDLKKRWADDYADAWVNEVLPSMVFAPVLIEPELSRLLGDVRGMRVLDAGCGEGVYARHLSRLGATVVGIDGSEKMIGFARARDGHIDFRLADLCEPLPFADGSFDAVISTGVLMSLPELDTFLSESRRILRPKGALVVAVRHPAFCNPTMRLHNPLWKRILRKPVMGVAFTYFYKPSDERGPEPWPFHHRTIEDYFEAFRQNGFEVDRLTEPHEIPQEILEENDLEYVTRLPRFIFFKLVKPGEAPPQLVEHER
jgi:SAM-dependent methyltransferase